MVVLPFRLRSANRILPLRLGQNTVSVASQLQPHQEELWEGLFSNPSPWSYNNNRRSQLLQSLCQQQQLEKAMDSLFLMYAAPSTDVYLSLLKACTIRKSLALAMLVYAHIALHVSELTGLLGDFLVVTLAKCGAIDDAYRASRALPCRTVFSWTAMISACADGGRARDALKMHELMQDDDVEPNQYTFASLFKACGNIHDLKKGKKLHDDARKKGFASVGFVGNTIVSMYGKCGAIADAEDVFSTLPLHDVVSWNAMLSVYVEKGQGEKALRLYRHMQEAGVNPGQLSLVSALQACGMLAEKEEALVMEGQSTKRIFLEIGQALHANAHQKGITTNVFVGTTLVSMYGKCGSLVEAENVFISMSQRNNVSWNAMLSAYIEQGQGKKALQLYRLMQEEGMDPDQHTIATALKACYILIEMEETLDIEGSCLEIGQAIYDDALRKGFASDVYVDTALLTVYGKCGVTLEAEKVFGALSHCNVVSWTAMLSAYVAGGQGVQALQLYRHMQEEGLSPDQQVLVIALQACGTLDEKEGTIVVGGQSARTLSLEVGQALHVDARRRGFASDMFVGSTLVSMYGKLGTIEEAESVFSGLSKHNVVSWTAMLSAYVEQGHAEKALQLYRFMQQEQGVSPDQHSLLIALQACGNLAEKEESGPSNNVIPLEIIQALHKDAWRKGYASDVFINSTLVSVYGKCGAIVEAENVFGALSQRNMVSWTAMASTCVEWGAGERVLQLYRHMQREFLSPDQVMFAIALWACGILKEAMLVEGKSTRMISLEIGQALHADARRKGFATNAEVGNALVSLYGKCGTIMEAEDAFNALSHCDAMSWNSMLSAYVEHGQGVKALQFYRYMQEKGTSPDRVGFVMALQACGALEENVEAVSREGQSYKTVSLEIVQALHADACRMGFTSDIFTGNTIVSMYGKCGTIMEAEDVFRALPHYGVSSWNAMFSAYVKQGQGVKALQLYRQMQNEHVTPDEVTSICILQACSETGSLETCKQLHFAIASAGHDLTVSLAAILIHAYGSCASMADGQAVFDGLPLPHLPSWTACVAGYAGEGSSIVSLQTFEKLQHARIKLDRRTFTSVLEACSHAGLVVEGLECFESMSRDYGIIPDSMHYGSMVDLLGRAGDFRRVENLLWKMPMQAVPSMWSSLLGACRVHGNLELGKQAFCNAVHLEPKQGASYVVMSNIFADSGLQDFAIQF